MDDRNDSGQMPFHSAVEAGAIDVVRLYVEGGADRSAQDNGGRTPLHLAAEKDNNQDMIRLLLWNGAASVNFQDAEGRTALHLAARKEDNEQAIEMLLESGANVRLQDTEGRTALHLASQTENHKKAVQMLLENYAHIRLNDPEELLGLHLATPKKDNEVAIKLLLTHGADIYTCDNTVSPAFPHAEVQLRRAVRNNNQEMVKLLLDRGADGVKGEPSFGQKSLGFAATPGSIQSRQISCWLAQNDVNINTANGHKVLVDVMMWEFRDDWESMISKADLNIEVDGKTILYRLVESNHLWLDKVDILLDRGARIDARYMDKTLLSVAAEKKHWGMVKKLVERGADVDVLVGGRTLLTWLLEHYLEVGYHERQQQRDLVKMVLDQNGEYAYVSKADEEGKTALGHALDAGLVDIAVLILEKYELEEVCDFLYGISRGLSYHTQ
ncbi:ankyrin repeat-containing domain protein [Ilyonectria sp. MPI-CAGE-AT-0026]|nr:ankyrin repeat-containing domain protein [Ilyonectria sp. MPI-CAGE-AT-0026]